MLLKSNNGNVMIGYDLGNINSQISYCYGKDETTLETVSLVAGAELYDIPTVLCKRRDVSQWFYGKEALRFYEEDPDEYILVDNLVELAKAGDPVILEDTEYQPEALLALFVKRSLGVISGIKVAEQTSDFMITCEKMDARMLEVLQMVAEGLHLKNTRFSFQSHMESFYHYMIYQAKELWLHRVLLFDYIGDEIRLFTMECNNRTTPIVCFIEDRDYAFGGSDEEMLLIAQGACEGNMVSSVYLIGEKFATGWMKNSLKFLCSGRRVFQGNNLYSKGAVYALLEKERIRETGQEYVFLGNDKLKANVGMNVFRQGEPSYLALLDAGGNWFESRCECDLYLEKDNMLELAVMPLIGKQGKNVMITLEGLDFDECPFTRVMLRLYLVDENRLCIEIEDLGFGEFRDPRGRWKEIVDLY